jgi:hypothetical protein
MDIDLVLRWVAEAATDPLPLFLSGQALLEVAVRSGELVTSDAGRKFVAAGMEIEIGLVPFGLPSARYFESTSTRGG